MTRLPLPYSAVYARIPCRGSITDALSPASPRQTALDAAAHFATYSVMNSCAVNSSRLVTHCTVPGRRRHLSFTRKLVA